jgi:HSP20 family protein
MEVVMAREQQTQTEREQRSQEQKQKQNAGTSTQSGEPRGTDRERQIERTQDVGMQGSLAPSRSGMVGYGPSGNSQALMRHMADDVDQLLQLFGFGSLGLTPTAQSTIRAVWSPQIEVARRDGELVVRADLPGMDPDDVTVEIDDGVLAISGERKEENEERRDGFYRSERAYGRFYRAIPLPEGVDEDRVEASFDKGVLEIRVPAPEQQRRQPKRVNVQSGT